MKQETIQKIQALHTELGELRKKEAELKMAVGKFDEKVSTFVKEHGLDMKADFNVVDLLNNLVTQSVETIK